MFYYPYSGEMSKTRTGLKAYNKSLVNQEYDADGTKMYENDFRVSPVYFVNAAEGGAKIDVQLTSIYAYGNIKAALPQAAAGAKVSKVLVKFGAAMTDSLNINAEEVAKLASMNYAYTTGAVTQANPDGAIEEKEAPIHISNVALLMDPKSKKKAKAVRVGYDFDENGKKYRVNHKTGTKLD